MLTVNALTAADEYLVVTDPAKFALDGIRGVTDTADVVRTYFNPELAAAGVIVNLADATLETGSASNSCARTTRSICSSR